MSVLMHEMLLCTCRTVTITETRTKQAKLFKETVLDLNIAWETSGVFSEDDRWTSSEPEVTYTGSMTLTTAPGMGRCG